MERISNFEKNNLLESGIKRLLVSHGIFTAGRVFFEVFLNVFIWKETGSFVLIAWFNIAYLMLHTMTFHVFAGLVKSGKVHLPRMLSLFGFTATYLVVFFMKGSVIDYVIPIGAIIGFFNGMYWISYQVLRFDLTNKDNRGNYGGLEGGVGTLVDISMPVFGGAIIAANFFGNGYSNLFLIGTIFFITAIIVGNVKFPIHKTPSLHIAKTFSILWKNKNVMKSMWAYTIGAISRNGALLRLILPLLIYSATSNSELKLGSWLSFFAIFAIFGSLIFGKFVDYKHYNKSLFIGGVAYFLLVILVLIYPSFLIYVLFGALAKVVTVAIDVPRRVVSENLIHSLPEESSHRVEYIVIREWFNIAFGRVLSYVALFFVAGLAGLHMKILIFMVAIAILVEMLFIRSIKWRT